MKRGWIVYGMLLSCLVFYVTALRVAGMMVCLPAEQTVCTLTRQESRVLAFPATVEGTSLKVLDMVHYEGAFLEDGGDTPIIDAMGILVENTGEHHVRSAWVKLTGAGKSYHFRGQDLPPGSRTILLETGGALWRGESFESITGGAETAEEDLLASGQLEITDVDIGSVAIKNLSEEPFFNLELTYKNYLCDGDIYQGGISYHHTIPVLRSGQTLTIFPERYASGYSRFVYAVAE